MLYSLFRFYDKTELVEMIRIMIVFCFGCNNYVMEHNKYVDWHTQTTVLLKMFRGSERRLFSTKSTSKRDIGNSVLRLYLNRKTNAYFRKELQLFRVFITSIIINKKITLN